MKRLLPILLALPFLGLIAWITFRNEAPRLRDPAPSRAKERGADALLPLPSLPADQGAKRVRPPVTPAAPAPGAEVGVLFGSVIGPDGKPAAGVLVYLTTPAAVVRVDGPKTVTDDAGRFLLLAKPGDYDVIAWRPGLLPAVEPEVRVAAGERLDSGVLELLTGLAIAGRVVDTEGRSIPDAVVLARTPDLQLPEGGLPGRAAAGQFTVAMAGADGGYRLTGLMPGRFIVFAEALGYAMTGEPREVPAGETGVVIELRQLMLVTGRILREIDGEPIPGATVKLEIRTRKRNGEEFYKTASSGRFSFDLTAGNLEDEAVELTLRVSAPGYVEQAAAGLSLEELSPPENYVLRLIEAVPEEPGALNGRVLYDTGAAFEGSLTLSFTRPGRAGEIFRVETDTEGRFRLTGIPPGEYRLHSAPHRSELLLETGKTLLITAGGEETTEFTIPRGGDVQITVTDDRGEPVAGAEAALLGETPEETRVHPAREGGVVFIDLPPGEAKFRVSAPGHESVTLSATVVKDLTVGLSARLPAAR